MGEYSADFSDRARTLRDFEQPAGFWSVRDACISSMRTLDDHQLALRKDYIARVGEQGYAIRTSISLLEDKAVGFVVFGCRSLESYWSAGVMRRGRSLVGFVGRRVKRRDGAAELVPEATAPLECGDDMASAIGVNVAVLYEPELDANRIEVLFEDVNAPRHDNTTIMQFSRYSLDGKVGLGAIKQAKLELWAIKEQAIVAAPDACLE